MFQHISSVKVEYVVRISSATTFYIDYWKVFENVSHAGRQADTDQTDLQLSQVRLS